MICIGIDPGTKTGVAVWDTEGEKFLSVETLPIHRAMQSVLSLVLGCNDKSKDIQVVFEDARQRTWFGKGDAYAKLQGAGSVKRDCSIWEEWCETYGIEYVCPPPRQGMTKLTDAYFRGITGYDRRTNNHGRDAAMLVFGR